MLTHNQIIAVVCRIPEGKVASYGQVARLCGYPRHARQVGYALAALPTGSDVPWHRVINAKGQISERLMPGADEYQRILLEAEGVEIGLAGKIDLQRFGWSGD
ncbi:MAG: MGMT family protein [Nevskiales bacterium]